MRLVTGTVPYSNSVAKRPSATAGIVIVRRLGSCKRSIHRCLVAIMRLLQSTSSSRMYSWILTLGTLCVPRRCSGSGFNLAPGGHAACRISVSCSSLMFGQGAIDQNEISQDTGICVFSYEILLHCGDRSSLHRSSIGVRIRIIIVGSMYPSDRNRDGQYDDAEKGKG